MNKIAFHSTLKCWFLLVMCLLGTRLQARNDDLKSKATQALRKNSTGFVQNKGQLKDQYGNANTNVKYVLNTPGLKVELQNGGFSYDTWMAGTSSATFHRVDIELEGANTNAMLVAEQPLTEVVNVISNNKTIANIQSFYKVTYKDIYPGIDLEFLAEKGSKKPVEYNFIIHPGADASLIRLHYKGAHDLALKENRIAIQLNHGMLEESIPASWLQQSDKDMDIRYKEISDGLYAFQVPDYDHSQTLIIDPTPNLEWATLIGGPNTDQIFGVDVDSAGNIYVTGSTRSTTNIATAGAYDGSLNDDEDAFIAKFSSAGQRLWATYYGGDSIDNGSAITYHGEELYIGGYTKGSPGMATSGAFQAATQDTIGNNAQGFLARFDANTGIRTWGTYYGGFRGVSFSNILVDGQGNFYAYGSTRAAFFPLGSAYNGNMATSGTYRPTIGTATNAVGLLVKFDNTNTRQWGTFTFNHGLTFPDEGIAFGPDGHIYIAGTVPATTPAFAINAVEGQTFGGGTLDGAIMKIDKDNGTEIWGRYFGGTGMDRLSGIACDGDYLYVTGYTNANDGIATPGAFRPSFSGAIQDGFFAKFTLTGERVFGTYLGTASNTTAYTSAIKLDAQSNINILGVTSGSGSTGLASNCTYQPVAGANQDLFINRFSKTGQRLWGTYFGGNGSESINTPATFGVNVYHTLAIDNQGNVILGARVPNNDLVTPGTFQTTYGGGDLDGLLAKFNTSAALPAVTLTPSSLSPASQTTCILGIPAIVTGNVVNVSSPFDYAGTVYYQWQVADSVNGVWTNLTGEVAKNLQPPAASSNKYYRRLIMLNTDYCNVEAVDTSSVVSVLVNNDVAPVANADGPQWYVCGSPDNAVTLNGSANGGTAPYTYKWFAGSTSTPVDSQATYSPVTTLATTYTLQVTDAAGCVDLDQATVVPAFANAGTDKSICEGSGGVQIGTTPIASQSISYSWISVSGDPISTLSCTNCAQPIANPTATTTYQLTVTVLQKDGTPCSSTDTVIVTPVAAPIPGFFAGTDTTVCRGSSMTLGANTPDATFSYNWSPGSYLSDASAGNPIFNAGSTAINCSVNYQAIATKAGCTFYDEVKVSAINPDIYYQGESVCGPLWINGKFNNCAQATYSWAVVSGTGSVLQTSNGGANAYLSSPTGNTVFRRTTTLNGVSCTADITVSNACGGGCAFIIDTIATFGCPKVFPSGPLFQLTAVGVDTTGYTISWSPASMVDNPSATTVTVTSGVHTTITCTITNSYDPSITCSESVEVNNPSWSLPSFVINDKQICYNTAASIGIPTVAGYNYSWTPGIGLSDANVSNPSATLNGSQTYRLKISEAGSGCYSDDTVQVDVIPVVADAGTSHTVCNGGTVLLGSAPPVGTNFNYSWSPAGAAWTNGSGPTDPQPQVIFASSSQIFALTVTDPLSGCASSDTITLSSTITPGEYSGTDDTVCAGAAVQLGGAPAPFANYEWTLADDSPAAGLSCTTCANPTLTAPDTTTTYKVKVSYPGCTIPTEDLVTITVNPAPAFTLIDQSSCPATPLAIGFGAPGNSSDTTNIATYAWTPVTGLSCADCSNPTTTAQVPTSYQLLVTYANGCQQKDSVMVTPSIIINAGCDMAICAGESTIIGMPAEPGLTYSWSGGPFVGSSAVAQPTVNPTITTIYTVLVSNGTCTDSTQVVVTVNTPADFTVSGNTSICQGGMATVGLSAAQSPNTSWQWSPLIGVANPNSPYTTIAADTTRTYRLTQTNMATGCSSYKDVLITVSPNNITITTTDTSICAGTTLALPLTVSPAGSYQYIWTPSIGLSNAYVANPDVTTNVDRNYIVAVTDNATHCQVFDTASITIKPEEECLPPVLLSGNVFHDANGLNDATVNSTSILAIPTGLYVSLISDSAVINTVPVNADGTFNFGLIDPGSYQIVLHQNPTGSIIPGLPDGWKNMGEQLNAGVGNDGTINGILTGITISTSNVTNANFGIQQPPLSDAKTYTIDAPSTNDTIVLNGTHVSIGTGTSSPGQLTGTDPEDGILDGTGNNKTLVITAAPNYGVLWYNGALVTAGDMITNYNPDLLSLVITDTAYSMVSFQYAYVDQAGVESEPVLYTINWSTPLPVTLVDFNAIKMGNKALLQWEAVKEENSDHFIVERSADSRSWQAIAQIPAAGNSNGSSKYWHYDNTPMEEVNFYRLVMISLDGGHEYSMIRRLTYRAATWQINVVPNPAYKSAVIILDKDSKVEREVRLRSMAGQTVHSFTIPAGIRQYPLDLSKFAPGMYTISIETSGNTESIKLIVQ